MIAIYITRDSVCMGDDVKAPHLYIFEQPSHTKLNDIFIHLFDKSYLPPTSGATHVWEVMINDKVSIKITGNNHIEMPDPILFQAVESLSIDSTLKLWFRYKSSNT